MPQAVYRNDAEAREAPGCTCGQPARSTPSFKLIAGVDFTTLS
ncbi:MAG: hypothetical protein ACUVS4_03810 [Chloroflexaceae bacterium]